MSSKDFGGYKRIVQYFWDPEPKNDDPLKSPIWCLGRRYITSSRSNSDSSKVCTQQSGDSDLPITRSENSNSETSSSGSTLVNAESDASTRPNGFREEVSEWPADFLDDFESRIWFTYRAPAQPTSGPGRLLFRHGLGMHDPFGAESVRERIDDITVRERHELFFLSREQISDSSTGWRRGTRQREERELLGLFADDPDTPFSIHRFVEHGALACGKHPGEWFGPSATARCIQALARSSVGAELKVYINGDGADVYEDRVLSLATNEDGHFIPTLILVGIRLGIDRITPVYWEALKASLQLPQSVGIAGGRPSSSHYFVGVQGDHFFFLDPHQPRPALPRREDIMEYSMEDIDSCHTRRLRRIAIQEMDPSMLIGFLIHSREDWREWRKSVTKVQGKPVIHIADKEPIMEVQDLERPNEVYDVETLDDENEDDGELVERP
ncbi:MAG: hypothetical protein Q9170_002549 [Blastenia crenularia]